MTLYISVAFCFSLIKYIVCLNVCVRVVCICDVVLCLVYSKAACVLLLELNIQALLYATH